MYLRICVNASTRVRVFKLHQTFQFHSPYDKWWVHALIIQECMRCCYNSVCFKHKYINSRSKTSAEFSTTCGRFVRSHLSFSQRLLHATLNLLSAVLHRQESQNFLPASPQNYLKIPEILLTAQQISLKWSNEGEWDWGRGDVARRKENRN